VSNLAPDRLDAAPDVIAAPPDVPSVPSLAHLGTAGVAAGPVRELHPGREVVLGESTRVRRLLPSLHRRLVGAWCFVDHYGPDDVSGTAGMVVPPHPHIGLQTVSWLLTGRVHHRDSLGNDAHIAPGELGLMTAGRGIAHAEHSPTPHPALLHGVQLWVALPSASKAVQPAWQHSAALPSFDDGGLQTTVILGTLAGQTSPGAAYSPLVGAALTARAGASTELPVEPDFEYSALVMSGDVTVDGVPLGVGAMLYLGTGRRRLAIAASADAEVLLLGGQPFEEKIVMWWNFVASDGEEIVQARRDWEDGTRFGAVPDAGAPLAAPPLPDGVRLKPGGATR
jgi:redox-sensitive bicupin YhaK (pirin superfamily)